METQRCPHRYAASLLLIFAVALTACASPSTSSSDAVTGAVATATRVSPTKAPMQATVAMAKPSLTPIPTRTVVPTKILPTPTPRPTATPRPTPTPLPTPRGTRAKIISSMPSSVPCAASADNCKWSYTVTFSETNGIAVTIDRIRRRYVTPAGATYTSAGSDGWFNTTISIGAYGVGSYSSWINGLVSRFALGKIIINYTGKDALGNTVSGEVRATMAKPK
jgi:hypothetical protein